eukprot:SAG31_NODE_3221_length_4526_cov_2.643099_4_plen_141_part_00
MALLAGEASALLAAVLAASGAQAENEAAVLVVVAVGTAVMEGAAQAVAPAVTAAHESASGVCVHWQVLAVSHALEIYETLVHQSIVRFDRSRSVKEDAVEICRRLAKPAVRSAMTIHVVSHQKTDTSALPAFVTLCHCCS